jgi:hypothetical protein
MMRKRMRIMVTAILGLAAAAAITAPAVAAPQSGPDAAVKSDAFGDRNVRRTPAVLLQNFMMSPGCSGSTLPIDCRIDEPVVTQHEFTYPFSFLPGDHVTVEAGGCVQVGGHGLTWKRYVDPAADNDLYHGLITVPTATGELERLVNVIGRQIVIGGRGPAPLKLGYEDEDGAYGDNGYYAHDNGTGNQCLGVGPAWVRIVIT